jgi:hypothetical protein
MQQSDYRSIVVEASDQPEPRLRALTGRRQNLNPQDDRAERGLRSLSERPEALLKSWRHTGPVAVGAPWLKQPPVYPLF